MSYDRLFTGPLDHDPEAPQRVARLRALGLNPRPDAEFDHFAATLATAAAQLIDGTTVPYAMVNLIDDRQQYFAGLHTPSTARPGAGSAAAHAAAAEPNRTMSHDQGWCPEVVSRRRPLVLDDVCIHPRFGTNRVVDELNIRTYMGAPLIDRTDTVLGTVCVIDTEQRPWGRRGWELISQKAHEMMELIHRRGRRS